MRLGTGATALEGAPAAEPLTLLTCRFDIIGVFDARIEEKG